VSAPRRWVRRALLSALAGSGITVAGLGGPVSGAVGAEGTTGTTPNTGTTGTTETPPSTTTPQATTPEAGAGQPANTTSTSSTPANTTPAATTPAPTTTTPAATTPAATTPGPNAPASGGGAGREHPSSAPTVVIQQSQQTTGGAPKPSRGGSRTGERGTGNGKAGNGNAGGKGAGAKSGKSGAAAGNGSANVPPGTPNGVAPAPQAVGAESAALSALLAGTGSSAVSAQALDFYRIPLFLLPIYQAAASQYDVPWSILAAINEVETDYGTDLSVSTAGAVGWMQFMPQTWLMYGVDATAAGSADPYNPVDAVFAAARYLHAAGAAHHLRGAIFAYNHSAAYVESVLLRARLIASYPRSVIDTLTGLVDGRLPTPGARVAPTVLAPPASGIGAAGLAGVAGSAGAGAGETADAGAGGSSTAGSPGAAGSGSSSASSATAGALPANPLAAGAAGTAGVRAGAGSGAAPDSGAAGAPSTGAAGTPSAHSARTASAHHAALPGSTLPPPPQVAAARAEAAADAPAKRSQLVELLGTPGAPVLAVQSGRVVHLGESHALGRYLVLRDPYGDIFTYAGLGSIAPRYPRPTPPTDSLRRTPSSAAGAGAGAGAGVGTGTGTGVGAGAGAGTGAGTAAGAGTGAGAGAGGHGEPKPTLPASAGHQAPLTLHVKQATASAAATSAPEPEESESTGAGLGKVRLYAHPHNPLARAAAARAARSAATVHGRWLPLHTGSLVSAGTVLGHLPLAPGPGAGQLRFAARPAGDSATIDPTALIANWRQLGVALRPKGARRRAELLGATADAVFAMSKEELQRSTLADPGVTLDACARRDVAAGAIDRRALAALEFLSRSGLQPTVGALRCAREHTTLTGTVFEHFAGGSLTITAINDTPIAGHQGPGTVTDAAIRALLTLKGQYAPDRIVSLMEYPHTPTTLARASAWNHIQLGFGAFTASTPTSAHAARAARARGGVDLGGAASESLHGLGGGLSQTEWNALIARIAALPQPAVAAKPSSAAIRDPRG
jgi:hypothetical protein